MGNRTSRRLQKITARSLGTLGSQYLPTRRGCGGLSPRHCSDTTDFVTRLTALTKSSRLRPTPLRFSLGPQNKISAHFALILFCGPSENRTRASAMRMRRNTTLLSARSSTRIPKYRKKTSVRPTKTRSSFWCPVGTVVPTGHLFLTSI